MSIENVKKFMELVKAEESLAKRMVALKDGLQEGEFAFKNDKEFVEKKILPLAKEYGIEFSVEDFMEFTSSQLTSLSEDELAEVSGGFPGLSLLMGLSLFIGGGAMTTAAQKAVSYFTGSGTSTSTVRSVTDQDVDNSVTVEAGQTAESQKQREIDINFKKFVSQKKKALKKKLNDSAYLSPVARKDKINEISKSLSGTTSDGQNITAVYNEKTDDVTFKSDKASQTETVYYQIRTPLYKAQSTNLAHQYDEAIEAAQLTQKYNELNQQLQQKKSLLSQYASIEAFQQSINTGVQTITSLIRQLQKSVDGTLDMNTDFNALKESFMRQGGRSHYGTYYYTYETQIKLIDQIIELKKSIATDHENVKKINTLRREIDQINSQMQEIVTQWQPYADKQKAFNDNMKTEFNYFFGALYSALKGDTEINQLAEAAKTADAKITLANKIKKTADKIIKEKLQDQLLVGCNFEFVQTDLMFDIKVHYNNQGWFSTFSVDDFISKENHLQIINSEANKKRDEVAKKLAEYIQKKYTNITDGNELNGTIQSVLKNLKKNGNLTIKENSKETTVDLGIEIVNITNDQVTFSLASGSEQRETILTIKRIADEFNKMVNMQAMETTRRQNEGTIEYTSFGRKWWNSIGSQAQHVLDTLNQIDNLSDVKDRETFENDLKYVANQIAEESRGNVKKMYLAGEHRNDYSFNKKDLKKIKDFAAQIKKR